MWRAAALLFPLGAALCAHRGLAPSNGKSNTTLSVAESFPSRAARGASEEHKMQVSCWAQQNALRELSKGRILWRNKYYREKSTDLTSSGRLPARCRNAIGSWEELSSCSREQHSRDESWCFSERPPLSTPFCAYVEKMTKVAWNRKTSKVFIRRSSSLFFFLPVLQENHRIERKISLFA